MNLKKTVSSALATGLIASSALVALAAPASASNFGPELPGDIYMFPVAGGWDANTYADIVTSGPGGVRPFQSATTGVACPAATTNIQVYVHIPQAGQPRENWDATALTALSTAQDAQGRFYTARADTMNRASVINYLATQPGNTGTLPLDIVCQGSNAGEVFGYFTTMMTASGTDATNFTWSVPTPAQPPLPASTTTLAASATSITFGDSVDLTATVAPASATGDVEFFAGTTSLGTVALDGSSGVAVLSTSSLPVGTQSVTAQYLGGSNAASTSATVEIVVAAAPAIDTTTVLTVTPASGDAYQSVTLEATVAPVAGAAVPTGAVQFFDGTTPLGTAPLAAGVASLTTNGLGAGTHSVTAVYTPADAAFTGSTSAAVEATYTLVGAVDEQTVVVTIPVGTITITSPYTPTNPLNLGTAVLDPADSTYSTSAFFGDIVLTDTRAGNLGFTASVVSSAFASGTGSFGGEYAGFTGVTATQFAGNAMQASNVTTIDNAPLTPGLAAPRVFATYPAGGALGTVGFGGTFGIDGVPSSVQPGLYTATVTFTAI